MKNNLRRTLLALSCLAAFAANAQSTQKGADSTITTPPQSISSQAQTPGADSTYQGTFQSLPTSTISTLSLPISSGGGGNGTPPPPPPGPTCLNGQQSTSTITQTASCPPGYETNLGSLTFMQSATRTTTTSCPAGPYGAPSYSSSDGAWSPLPTAACPVPQTQHLANDGKSYGIGVKLPVVYQGRFTSGDAELAFVANTAGWFVKKAGWTVPMTVVDSGSLPTGAVSVSFVPGPITQDGDDIPRHNVTFSNGQAGRVATGKIALSAQPVIKLATPIIAGSSDAISSGTATVTVFFYNASGSVIATSTFTFTVSASGSA